MRARARISRPAASSSIRASAIAEAYKTGRGCVPRARALDEGGDRPRHLVRSSSPRFPGWCRRRGWSSRSPSCSTRRSCRCSPTCATKSAEDVRLVHRAEAPHGRSRAADGIAVQADRAREPHSAQHERAGRRARSRRCSASPKCLREWLDHRREVLVRRSKLPPGARSSTGSRCSTAISIAYLNLDKVIRIIRDEDEPKPELMKALQAHRRAGRGHPQHAAAQLAQARGDGDQRASTRACARSGTSSRRCSAPTTEQWKTIADEIKEIREDLRPEDRRSASAARPSPTRRSTIEADDRRGHDRDASRSPSCVSEKGWIRALQRPCQPTSPASASRTTTR